MTHDLLHGDVAAAAVDNVFLLIGLPLLAIWSAWRIRRGQPAVNPTIIAVITIAGFA